MKTYLVPRPLFAPLLILFISMLLCTACKKDDGPSVQTSKDTDDNNRKKAIVYPADLALSWINLQLKLNQTTPSSPTVQARRFA